MVVFPQNVFTLLKQDFSDTIFEESIMNLAQDSGVEFKKNILRQESELIIDIMSGFTKPLNFQSEQILTQLEKSPTNLYALYDVKSKVDYHIASTLNQHFDSNNEIITYIKENNITYFGNPVELQNKYKTIKSNSGDKYISNSNEFDLIIPKFIYENAALLEKIKQDNFWESQPEEEKYFIYNHTIKQNTTVSDEDVIGNTYPIVGKITGKKTRTIILAKTTENNTIEAEIPTFEYVLISYDVILPKLSPPPFLFKDTSCIDPQLEHKYTFYDENPIPLEE